MNKLLFALLAVLYLILYSVKIAGLYFPVISAYGADLLCLPIVLSISRFIMIRFGFVPESFELSMAKILAAAVLFSLVFELILPRWSHEYHSDPYDILAYFLGGILYYAYRLFNRKKHQHEIAV